MPRHNAKESRSPVRDQMVLVRLNRDERDEATRGAAKAGIPLSTYLRDRGLAAARRETKRAA